MAAGARVTRRLRAAAVSGTAASLDTLVPPRLSCRCDSRAAATHLQRAKQRLQARPERVEAHHVHRDVQEAQVRVRGRHDAPQLPPEQDEVGAQRRRGHGCAEVAQVITDVHDNAQHQHGERHERHAVDELVEAAALLCRCAARHPAPVVHAACRRRNTHALNQGGASRTFIRSASALQPIQCRRSLNACRR